jgi:hypothetical protein
MYIMQVNIKAYHETKWISNVLKMIKMDVNSELKLSYFTINTPDTLQNSPCYKTE